MIAAELQIGHHYTDGETIIGVYSALSTFNANRTIVQLATGYTYDDEGTLRMAFEAVPVLLLKEAE